MNPVTGVPFRGLGPVNTCMTYEEVTDTLHLVFGVVRTLPALSPFEREMFVPPAKACFRTRSGCCTLTREGTRLRLEAAADGSLLWFDTVDALMVHIEFVLGPIWELSLSDTTYFRIVWHEAPHVESAYHSEFIRWRFNGRRLARLLAGAR